MQGSTPKIHARARARVPGAAAQAVSFNRAPAYGLGELRPQASTAKLGRGSNQGLHLGSCDFKLAPPGAREGADLVRDPAHSRGRASKTQRTYAGAASMDAGCVDEEAVGGDCVKMVHR